MPYSMTGYGYGESLGFGLSCTTEIRSRNHRYRDIFVRLPKEFAPLEFEDRLRVLMTENIARGRIDVSVTVEEAGESLKTVKINRSLIDSYLQLSRQLGSDYGLPWDLGVSAVILLPGVMELASPSVDSEEVWRLVQQSAEVAIAELKQMRMAEGAVLAKDVAERTRLIEEVIEKITERAPRVHEDYKMKLEARLKELLGDSAIDEGRIIMETAIYADKSDITEELVRLGSHCSQVYAAINQDEPVGRRLEFLVQEMQREVNTIGSKAQDVDISHMVVDIKSELEKIREQIQNIE